MTSIHKIIKFPAFQGEDAALMMEWSRHKESVMILCPDCRHPNSGSATQCAACHTPLPATSNCPDCGASMPVEASFCGQCGLRQSVSGPASGALSEPLMPLGDSVIATGPTAASQPMGEAGAPVTPPAAPAPVGSPANPSAGDKTQLQQSAYLLHVQTNTAVELPQNFSVIHIGKPNDRIPPDIDVAGFPHSEIVSRIHIDIRVEGDSYFIEDIGSANGTYINHTFLALGNRHRLRHGDRIALGKGDLVSFLFQLD